MKDATVTSFRRMFFFVANSQFFIKIVQKKLVLLVFSYSLPSVFPSLCPSLAFLHFLRCKLLGYFIDQPSEGFWHCLLSAVCGEACLLFQSLTFIIDGELQVILVSIFVEKHCLQINNFKPKAELIKTN